MRWDCHIYVVSKCANEIEEFRYRFVDGLHVGKLADLLQKTLDELENEG